MKEGEGNIAIASSLSDETPCLMAFSKDNTTSFSVSSEKFQEKEKLWKLLKAIKFRKIFAFFFSFAFWCFAS